MNARKGFPLLRSAGLSAFAYEPAGMILTPAGGLASPPRCLDACNGSPLSLPRGYEGVGYGMHAARWYLQQVHFEQLS